MTRPTRFEDEGGHQTPFTSGGDGSELRRVRWSGGSAVGRLLPPSAQEGPCVKKLLLLLVLVALGALVAKKVREA